MRPILSFLWIGVSLVLAASGPTNAFQIPPRLEASRASTKDDAGLSSSIAYDDGAEPVTLPASAVSPSPQRQEDVPSWIDLPKTSASVGDGAAGVRGLAVAPTTRRRSFMDDLPKTSASVGDGALPSAEIIVGRIAMVGALSLFLNEVLYGKSVIEQFVDAFKMMQ
eukprot:CAMPEP_0197464292 /NCGR_PEP_ID=MMETSP1175-20131217/63946_1 /TAXON_ID=1003142 /ORGANISM="Triceratium dubium, Strain CCMP147" /LENGTH=165 /DNA_ID=CAMNT_0043000265 /DNA_START=256 /DNA_END=754 /DNA_ORIENTATION=-